MTQLVDVDILELLEEDQETTVPIDPLARAQAKIRAGDARALAHELETILSLAQSAHTLVSQGPTEEADPETAVAVLGRVVDLAAQLEELKVLATTYARDHAATWEAIGHQLGMNRSNANRWYKNASGQ